MLIPLGMDQDCVELFQALNELPGISTTGSCCGHGSTPYHFWFRIDNLTCEGLALLLRCTDSRYGSPGHWSVKIEETDLSDDPIHFLLEGGLNYYHQSVQLAKMLREPTEGDRKWLASLRR
jgi:hypothetical protein